MGNTKCIFCGSDVKILGSFAYSMVSKKLQCPVCGIYEFISDYKINFINNRNEFSFYLYYYNKIIEHDCSYKILLVNNIGDNKKYEEQGYKLIDYTYVKSLYPKTLIKKLDYILFGLSKKVGRIDNKVNITVEELSSIFIIDKIFNGDSIDYEDAWKQLTKLISYLQSKNILTGKNISHTLNAISELSFSTEGWLEVEKIEHYDTVNKGIFIALAFCDKTVDIRRAIKDGIIKAGYEPIVIDEKIYNKQIVPEIFEKIRNCKMLIMDATYQNFGAYYEAGYALGQNKEVVVCCKKDTFDEGKIHFDVKQRQCLLWNSYEELTERLIEWIKALL